MRSSSSAKVNTVLLIANHAADHIADLCFEYPPAIELRQEFACEAGDFLLDRFGVGVNGVVESDVAARGEDEVVVRDLLDTACLAEPGNVLVALVLSARTPRVVGAGDAFNVVSSELTLRAGDHFAHVAGVDEEHFAVPVTVPVPMPVLREEPQAGRDARVEEEFVGQGHDAIDQVGLDDGPADDAIGLRLGGQCPVGMTKPAMPEGLK